MWQADQGGQHLKLQSDKMTAKTKEKFKNSIVNTENLTSYMNV